MKLKIAVVTEGTISEKIGEGHELRLFEIFRRLSSEHNVHIIQPAPDRRTWMKEGIFIHNVPPLPGRLGVSFFRNHFFLTRYLHAANATREIRKINPEVVDIFGFILPTLKPEPAVVGSFAHYEKGPDIKRLYSFISVLVRKELTIVKLRKSDYLVMMSRNTEKQLSDSGLLEGKEFSYVPNGVNPRLFYKRDRIESRKTLGLPVDRHLVLLCGQLTEIKKPFDFLKGLEMLPENYWGVIVGRGPLKEKLADFISKSGLESRVSLAGYVEKELLPLYYSAADVSAYLGEQEIQPLVPQESLACGTPAVVSDAPGNNELVQDGVTGALFAPGNIGAFISAVRSICESAGLRDAMSRAGLEFMKERNWDITARLTMDAYRKALDISRRRKGPEHLI